MCHRPTADGRVDTAKLPIDPVDMVRGIVAIRLATFDGGVLLLNMCINARFASCSSDMNCQFQP